jgi:hypothetical protein
LVKKMIVKKNSVKIMNLNLCCTTTKNKTYETKKNSNGRYGPKCEFKKQNHSLSYL